MAHTNTIFQTSGIPMEFVDEVIRLEVTVLCLEE